MKTWSLGHLADHELLRDLTDLAARERTNTAELIAHIAEVDERRLFVPAAYESMLDWCVGELWMSEDAALKRIRVARTARDYPDIYPALADGRLNMTLIIELKPHLRPENAADLLAAAAGKSKQDLKELLAARFPKSDTLELVQGPTSAGRDAMSNETGVSLALEPVNTSQVPSEATSTITPLSAGSFEHRLTVSRDTNEKLHYAKDLLGHALPSGKFADVLDRALDALIAKLEQKKFGVTSRARRGTRKSVSPRYIPMSVRRAIHARDGGRCTFVSDCGRRCDATTRLEFDHETPIARGGPSTLANLRLRCRAHNQHAAEQTYGKDFMRHKREAAAASNVAPRAADARDHLDDPERVREEVAPRTEAHDSCDDSDVTPWLRKLGYSAAEARRAAESCAVEPGATLEQRVRASLAAAASQGRAEWCNCKLREMRRDLAAVVMTSQLHDVTPFRRNNTSAYPIVSRPQRS